MHTVYLESFKKTHTMSLTKKQYTYKLLILLYCLLQVSALNECGMSSDTMY